MSNITFYITVLFLYNILGFKTYVSYRLFSHIHTSLGIQEMKSIPV